LYLLISTLRKVVVLLLTVALLLPGAVGLTLADSPTVESERALPAQAAPQADGEIGEDAGVELAKPAPPDVQAALASQGLMFVENVGQFSEETRFRVYGALGDVWLADDGLWITLVEPAPKQEPGDPRLMGRAELEMEAEPEPRKAVHLRLSFAGANPHARLEPFGRLETKVSYFFGADADAWRPDVPVWAGVRYVDLYPGLDLEMTGDQARWAWRMNDNGRLSAASIQSALSQVRLNVEGGELAALEGGQFLVETALGALRWPLIGAESAPAGATEAEASVEAGQLVAPFAQASALWPASDAVLADRPGDLRYATFLGNSSTDCGNGIAVDGAGNAYVTGEAYSYNFGSSSDAFVVKLNASGTALAYATFLGGSDSDYGYGIAVDGTGNAYITGYTYSSNFPAALGPGYDTSHNGGWDAFVVKLNASGTALAYATFLGGWGNDYCYDIAVDASQSAFVIGYTYSSNFPVTDTAFSRALSGHTDAFVTRLSLSGMSHEYSTFLGGSLREIGLGVVIDMQCYAYLVGQTASYDFPVTAGAFDRDREPGADYAYFVAKLSPTGSALSYATYLGLAYSGDPYVGGIAVDSLVGRLVRASPFLWPQQTAWLLHAGDIACQATRCSRAHSFWPF
jgi:hypothetical protein